MRPAEGTAARSVRRGDSRLDRERAAPPIGGIMTRHILGVLGVLAALVLLVVSMMMNYQFGSSLGKTATDKHIYGMASAAADCFKALAPFFFFAALRNRVWSQAVAAALVWAVVTVYAFTSAHRACGAQPVRHQRRARRRQRQLQGHARRAAARRGAAEVDPPAPAAEHGRRRDQRAQGAAHLDDHPGMHRRHHEGEPRVLPAVLQARGGACLGAVKPTSTSEDRRARRPDLQGHRRGGAGHGRPAGERHRALDGAASLRRCRPG